jgi:hypothetical protein
MCHSYTHPRARAFPTNLSLTSDLSTETSGRHAQTFFFYRHAGNIATDGFTNRFTNQVRNLHRFCVDVFAIPMVAS